MKTPISINLNNKVVVITGAGGVICGCLAKALASNGAKVALLDLNLEAAEAVANEIVAEGGVAKAYKTNVLDKESLEAVREEIEKDYRRYPRQFNASVRARLLRTAPPPEAG